MRAPPRSHLRRTRAQFRELEGRRDAGLAAGRGGSRDRITGAPGGLHLGRRTAWGAEHRRRGQEHEDHDAGVPWLHGDAGRPPLARRGTSRVPASWWRASARRPNATHARSSPLTWGTRRRSRTPTPRDSGGRPQGARPHAGRRAGLLVAPRAWRPASPSSAFDVAAPASAARARALEAEACQRSRCTLFLVNRSAAIGTPIRGGRRARRSRRRPRRRFGSCCEPGELLVVRPDGLLLCRPRDDDP